MVPIIDYGSVRLEIGIGSFLLRRAERMGMGRKMIRTRPSRELHMLCDC
jgi:hypothetical protein